MRELKKILRHSYGGKELARTWIRLDHTLRSTDCSRYGNVSRR